MFQGDEPLEEVESQAILQPFIDAFHNHSDLMCQVARFAAASSSDARSRFIWFNILCSRLLFNELIILDYGPVIISLANGSFTLMEEDLGTDPDSDSKIDGYIVLCRV